MTLPASSTVVFVRLQVDRRIHDMMRDLSKRRREFLSLTYERAAIAFLKQDENYQGMDITIPEHNERNETHHGRSKKEGPEKAGQ